MNRKKKCLYCKKRFEPSRYHPNQTVCSSTECQRRRRTEYHRRKLREDPEYREQCSLSRQKWREAHPGYMKRYLRKRCRMSRPLERLLDLARTNRVVDLKATEATILLIYPKQAPGDKSTFGMKKNILAHAKIVVLLGLKRAFLR